MNFSMGVPRFGSRMLIRGFLSDQGKALKPGKQPYAADALEDVLHSRLPYGEPSEPLDFDKAAHPARVLLACCQKLRPQLAQLLRLHDPDFDGLDKTALVWDKWRIKKPAPDHYFLVIGPATEPLLALDEASETGLLSDRTAVKTERHVLRSLLAQPQNPKALNLYLKRFDPLSSQVLKSENPFYVHKLTIT